MKSDEVKILEVDAVEQLQATEKALLDTQIVTAKQYPRQVREVTNNAIAIATMDKDTAESCGYALPRGNKQIQGPSVHLAKIIAQEWTNLRIEAKVVEINSTQVVSQAVCFDLEKNIAIKVEVRRSIVDKYGKRYKDDMITVTGNAANAIALRNAVFSVIPESVTKKVYQESKNMITGDLSDEAKLIKKRKEAVAHIKDTYGVTDQQILDAVGVGSMNAVKQDQIIIMRGFIQAIRDGDSTPEEIFSIEKKKPKSGQEKKNDLKNKKQSDKNPMP